MKKLYVLITLSLITGALSFGQTPKIVAHRGAWKNTNAPQNSIASLQEAIKQKVWGAEFDVQLTKDDILVVNHDGEFYGMDIATTTYQELLAVKHPNGEAIPTFEAYVKEGMKQSDTKLVAELKPSKLGVERTLKAAELASSLVKKLNAKAHVVYISFSYDACLKLRELDTDAHIQYLSFQLPPDANRSGPKNTSSSQYMAGTKTPKELKQARLDGFDYQSKLLKEKAIYIKDARKLGLVSNVWTVNTEEELKFFIDQGIDYITTDEPEILSKLLADYGS